MNNQSIQDYQLSQPDYLNEQYPRTVAHWHRFSKAEQAELKERERKFVTQSLGYAENPDGSFTKAMISRGDFEENPKP